MVVHETVTSPPKRPRGTLPREARREGAAGRPAPHLRTFRRARLWPGGRSLPARAAWSLADVSRTREGCCCPVLGTGRAIERDGEARRRPLPCPGLQARPSASPQRDETLVLTTASRGGRCILMGTAVPVWKPRYLFKRVFFFSFHIVVQGMQNEMYHFNHF